MTVADDFADAARELAKARPNPDRPEYVQALKARGPDGESRWLNITNAEYFRVVEALTTEPGLTYRVQAHEITELTWPMWDACGIECPQMIGAECARGLDRRDAAGKLMDCPGWSGKYDNAAAEIIHGWTMTSDQSEECGGGETGGTWYGLFRSADASMHDGPMGAGVILTVTGQGFVHANRHGTPAGLDAVWTTLLRETRECPHETDGCTGDSLCQPCTDDETADDWQQVMPDPAAD